MNTIQISLELTKNSEYKLSFRKLQEVKRYINNILSPRGYKYCKCLETSESSHMIVQISYPNFYAGTAAYVISSSKECLKVQKHFCNQLSNEALFFDAEIKLRRVDIPFIYMMDSDYDFYSYRKVFQVLASVYSKKHFTSNLRAHSDICKFKTEAVIYADTKNLNEYSNMIQVLDEDLYISSQTSTERELKQISEEYRDLHRRMRIEVSQRVKSSSLSIYEFSKLDIYKYYKPKYKKYILDNLFDLEVVKQLYEIKADQLIDELFISKRQGKINYENFIFQNIDIIYDYKILRKALVTCIGNIKTREAAITKVRKILNEYQDKNGIIVMNNLSVIKDMRSSIKNQFSEY